MSTDYSGRYDPSCIEPCVNGKRHLSRLSTMLLARKMPISLAKFSFEDAQLLFRGTSVTVSNDARETNPTRFYIYYSIPDEFADRDVIEEVMKDEIKNQSVLLLFKKQADEKKETDAIVADIQTNYMKADFGTRWMYICKERMVRSAEAKTLCTLLACTACRTVEDIRKKKQADKQTEFKAIVAEIQTNNTSKPLLPHDCYTKDCCVENLEGTIELHTCHCDSCQCGACEVPDTTCEECDRSSYPQMSKACTECHAQVSYAGPDLCIKCREDRDKSLSVAITVKAKGRKPVTIDLTDKQMNMVLIDLTKQDEGLLVWSGGLLFRPQL